LEVAFREEAELRNVLRQLEWGGAWLEVLVRRKIFSANDRLIAVLGLLATSVHHDRFQAAATAMVTEVASTLDCERVSIGFIRGQRCRLRALSHSASFNKKSNLIRAIEGAMDEAVDQQATVVYPARSDGPVQVTRAHAELGRDYGTGALCSVPFGNGSELLGAFCLERRTELPFDERTVELCEHVASVVGPVLDVKRLDDRWLIVKAWDALVTQARNLVGPRHVLLKLSASVLVLVTCFLIFAKGDYRISSDALLEGTVQRVIAAPMMGYVADANVRAGDIVAEGDVLCTLDDADLRLERVKWAGQRAQRVREYNEALAKRELARVRILAAQLDQADAQLALLDEQLARTRIVAPFDGIVVSGDLSQSLGAPVERGEVLFEVAPLDTYRVVLQVDERDITNISVGQNGHLALAALPNETHPFVVEKITPVSTSEEGLNYFRVEAHLEGDTAMLRPGMEGVGKIEVDERKLIWIWTHKFVHWVKMWVWSWWP
jgi:RND family efflux transporter MFP subunit